MFSPALRLLRERYPSARIDLLSMLKGAVEIYENNPDVNHVYWWDFMHRSHWASLRFVSKLRKNRYDVSINAYPQNRWEYNFVTRLVGAPKRLGHHYNHLNLSQLNFLTTHRVREVDARHNIEENVELLQFLDVPPGPIPDLRLHLPESALANAESWWSDHDLSTAGCVIGFHAGCATLKNHAERRWPAEHFSSLGRLLVKELGARILVFGGPDESELKRRVAEGIGPQATVVSTESLLDSIAILRLCHCMVSNDSALLHLGAAVRQRIVAIFGPTHDEQVYPWHVPHRVAALPLPCRPCFYHSPRPLTCTLKGREFACVRDLQPSTVLLLVREMLEGGGSVDSPARERSVGS